MYNAKSRARFEWPAQWSHVLRKEDAVYGRAQVVLAAVAQALASVLVVSGPDLASSDLMLLVADATKGLVPDATANEILDAIVSIAAEIQRNLPPAPLH